jgi:hypothetical protein
MYFNKSFRNVLKHGFKRCIFKNHDYNDDDLGAPSNVIRLGRITR